MPTNAGHVLKHANLGDIVKDKVPSLNCFFGKGNASQEFNIPSLAALSSAMRILQRCRCFNGLDCHCNISGSLLMKFNVSVVVIGRIGMNSRPTMVNGSKQSDLI